MVVGLGVANAPVAEFAPIRVATQAATIDGTRAVFPLSSVPVGCNTADLNGDGQPEALALNSTSVVVFDNDATVTAAAFAPSVQLRLSGGATNATQVFADHYDQDQLQDVVVLRAGTTVNAHFYRGL